MPLDAMMLLGFSIGRHHSGSLPVPVCAVALCHVRIRKEFDVLPMQNVDFTRRWTFDNSLRKRPVLRQLFEDHNSRVPAATK